MAFQVKPVQTKDLPLLNEIAFLAKQHWGYPEEWMALWKEDLTIHATHIKKQGALGLWDGSILVGFTIGNQRLHVLEIEHLWVRPKYFGKGAGRTLLQTLIQLYQQVEQVQVVSDPNAQGFYEKQGFKKIQDVDGWPKGRKLPVLQLTLAAIKTQ